MDAQPLPTLLLEKDDYTFTVSADTVTFVRPSDARSWTGVLQGRDLSIQAYDHLWLFRK